MTEMTRTSRRPQKRSTDTREALLAEATRLFTAHGFDGVSVRALEAAADVQHGAITYHFKGKEELWKAAIDRLLTGFRDFVSPMQATMEDLDEEGRIRMAIAAVVRYSALTPEFSRLMSQEGHSDTWRSRYLIDNFLRDSLNWINDVLGLNHDPHSYYIMIGAVTHIYDVAFACRELFGVDPTSDAFIKEHAARVADMLLAMKSKNAPRP